MGKGITFLDGARCESNFRFKKNKIISKRSDKGWTFKEIKHRDSFIKELLKKDIIVQEGIKPFLVGGSKVDLRIYVFMGEVLYIYPRRNDSRKVTTNISQGAKGSPHLLKKLPGRLVRKARDAALATAAALDLGLAGVDVVLEENGRDAYVIDVNLFPGFPKPRRFNLTKRIAGRLAEVC
jgi:glutathione synthase/RimK-type ligase-like ATP-grasp enzyme